MRQAMLAGAFCVAVVLAGGGAARTHDEGSVVGSSTLQSSPEKASENASTASEAIERNGPKGVSREYWRCVDEALGAIETATCISSERRRQDERLNRSYRELVAALDEEKKQGLVKAQREWLVLRELDGTFEAMLLGNTQMENLVGAEREMFYICDRADRLSEWLEIAKPE